MIPVKTFTSAAELIEHYKAVRERLGGGWRKPLAPTHFGSVGLIAAEVATAPAPQTRYRRRWSRKDRHQPPHSK